MPEVSARKVAIRAAQLWRIVAARPVLVTSRTDMAIAFFDLDGTITQRDTLFPLVLRLLVRRPLRLLRLLGVIPAVVRYAFDRDRGALKQSLLRATLRGLARAEVAAVSEHFVSDTIAGRCFEDALAAIRRHRDAGHHLVLMSASVDFYVPLFGRELGFHQVISTGVLWEGDRLEGTLTSANRRAEEKARCFTALATQRDDADTFAYGNSDSDLPHLRLARHGVLVNGSAAARRAAVRLGVATVEWA